MTRKICLRRSFLPVTAGLVLCVMSLGSCVTDPQGRRTIDLNYLIFGKEDDISWTYAKLESAPIDDSLVKLSNFSREASNLYRYAERIGVDGNTWYRVIAKGQSVYFVYKNVHGNAWTYLVYKSKYAVPTENPTITPEELKKVELAYEETVRFIKNRGKNLYINNMAERNAFIQKYQGSPDTEQVQAAKDKVLKWYNIRETSQEDIVTLARKEPNDFLKVRMIHDWVADIFAYDWDLFYLMEIGVIKGNAEFTLRAIVERQRGVCYEYAILFWFLLDAAGIDTYLISDFSQPGIGHAYNMVVINDTGYFVDTTWDSGNHYVFGEIVEFKRMITKNFFMPDIIQCYKLREGKW